jgi:outer membrane protein TolC
MRRTGRTITSLALAGVAWLSTSAGAQTLLTADRAVQLALEHNQQIINANAGVLDARSGLYGAYSTLLPHLSADLTRSGSQTMNQRGVQVFGGRVAFPSTTDEYVSYSTSPALSGTWSILNLSSLSSLSSARSGLKGAQWRRLATRAEVALEARRQFYEVVKAARLMGVSENALQLARDDERRVQTLFEVGSVSRSDLLKAQVRTAQSQLDSIAAQQSVLVQRDLLASFIGLEEAKLGDVDTVLTVTPREYDETSLLREAEASRPDLRSAEADVKAARAGLTAARLSWLPYVAVSGSATYNPVSTSTSTVSDTSGKATISGRNEADRQLSGRVALSWDFFDGLANSSRNASARARLERAQAAHDVLRRNLTGEVHEALLTYQQALGAEAVARRAVESAGENMKLTQQKYNVGSATILDLIDAQVQLQRAQSQFVSAVAGIRVAEARIEQVRGRGV